MEMEYIKKMRLAMMETLVMEMGKITKKNSIS